MTRSTFFRRFLPLLLSPVCLAFAAVGSLRAGVVKYPVAKPLITITLPDDWKSKSEDGNLYYNSPDKKLFVILSTAMATEGTSAADSAKNFAEGAKMTDVEVKDLGNDDDEESKMATGMAMGKKNGEDFVALVMNITLKNGGKFSVVFFGNKEAVFDEKTKEIANSLKPVK